MKSGIKTQIAGLFGSLQKAEEALGTQCRGGEGREATEKRQLLAGDMQQAALAAGNTIEETEGVGTRTVSLLESYCESLYQFTAARSAREREEQLRDIRALGRRMRESLDEEFPVVYEVVFLPYKASMWDAMESVWQAFQRREDVRTHVVPIPYYERRPDGSLGKEHWERELYPAEVPTEDYREFDLAGLHPDMIVIHNPYDGGNYVTSVDPAYYSNRLKTLTERLVYIPYFVFGDTVNEQLCQNHATLNADVVIVQNERVRSAYVKAYCRWLGASFPEKTTEQALAGKFLALGSPKADSAYRAKREDYVLPPAWRALMQGKKTVLYNTGLTALLRGDEAGLQKMRQVLRFFRYSKEYALWWRPHPLSEEMYASMRPELLQEYQTLTDWYREAVFGIYDDTPDLDRAIACTDLYYGADSSLVWLYGLTGKPMVLATLCPVENNDAIRRAELECGKIDVSVGTKSGETDDDWKAERGEADDSAEAEYGEAVSGGFCDTIFGHGCLYNGRIYFFASYYNALFAADPETGCADFLGEVPLGRGRMPWLYCDVVEKNGKLYLIPGNAGSIAVYDPSSEGERFSLVPLPEPLRNGGRKFSRGVCAGAHLCMLPGEQPYLLDWDLRTGKMRVTDIREKARRALGKALYPPYAKTGAVSAEGNVLFAIAGTDMIASYAPGLAKLTMTHIGGVEGEAGAVSLSQLAIFRGEVCVSLESAGGLFRWVRTTNRLERLRGMNADGPRCRALETAERALYFLPDGGEYIFVVGSSMEARPTLVCRTGETLYPIAADARGGLFLEASTGGGGENRLLFPIAGGEEWRSVPINTKRPYWKKQPLSVPFAEAQPMAGDYLLLENAALSFPELLELAKSGVSADEQERFEKAFSNAGRAGEAIADWMEEKMKG